jgi:hypothetical protein
MPFGAAHDRRDGVIMWRDYVASVPGSSPVIERPRHRLEPRLPDDREGHRAGVDTKAVAGCRAARRRLRAERPAVAGAGADQFQTTGRLRLPP